MADVFNTDPQTKTTPPAVDPLKELVGEGKKFKTVEDLAKGKLESDNFITQLQTEQAALRKQLAELDEKAKESITLKAVLEKLEQAKKPPSDDKTVTTPVNQNEDFDTKIAQYEQTKSRKTNRELANQSLVEKFNGDAAKASEFVASKAKELGLTKEVMADMAERSPSAFAQLLGLDSKTKQVPPTSFVPGVKQPQSNSPSEELNFLELKHKDKKKFWSPATQQALYRYGEEHGIEAMQKILNG